MWETKDLSFVIFLAVVSFVYAISIGQLPNLITGIIGLNYLFIFGQAIFVGLGLLLYEGRRWRFFIQSVIVALLFIPTFEGGIPFDVLARMPIVVANFFLDLGLNSIYGFFEKGNKMIWWAILGVNSAIILLSFFTVLNLYFFYPLELLTLYVNVVTLLLPVIIIECIIGAYIAYIIYQRVKNIGDRKTEIKYNNCII